MTLVVQGTIVMFLIAARAPGLVVLLAGLRKRAAHPSAQPLAAEEGTR
jgi:hypothetical protein